ncbi:hypothetical protein [Streptosporangium roseum]|uniref:hypothetical protein n=1 Tax=Streptosporangium roseum TaxID=2001 RepID=UPI0034425EF6
MLALRELRAWSGQRSYYDVAAAAGSRLAKSTLYDALNPNREHMPPLGIVRAIVVACHANVETWTQAWQRLRLQEHYQAPLPARPSIVRRDPFPLPAPGLATPLRGGPDANGHKPLGGRFGELTRLTSAQPRSPAGPSETAFDAALEDFERLRTSMSYPALLTAPPSDPDPGSGEVRGDLLTTEADGDHGGRRHLPADAPERLNDHPV